MDDSVDDLEEVASFHSQAIRTLCESFPDRAPAMLFDVREQRAYAYPYVEFSTELRTRPQRSSKEPYEPSEKIRWWCV